MEELIGSHEEEVVGSSNLDDKNNNNMMMMIKGKRTKRRHQRGGGPSSTSSLSSSSSSTANHSFSSLSSGEATEEEEDMANCLILLAQGHQQQNQHKFLIPNNTTVYECKTCNRSFPSFQALGGHRASHKKPKIDDDNKPPHTVQQNQDQQQNIFIFINNNNKNKSNTTSTNTNTKLVTGTNNPKVHECSICGSEFASGQALGGHMRRHRAAVGPSPHLPSPQLRVDDQEIIIVNRPIRNDNNNILALDLNLPAPPEDDVHRTTAESKFGFVFSAVPALVDCHY